MKKKILLLKEHGQHIPLAIHDKLKKLNKPFPASRYGEIIDFIESKAVSYDEQIHTNEYFRKNPKALVRKYGNFYFGISSTNKNILTAAEIVEIDTDKQWIIDDCGRNEIIMEVPQYKCIDPEINLYIAEYEHWR